MDWQPIETAPRSGEALIAYEISGTRMLCRGENGGCSVEPFKRTKISVGHRMMSKPGAYRIDEKGVDGKRITVFPTHWMPLPAPPNA